MKRYLLSLLVLIPFTFALVSCDKVNLFGGPLTLEEAIEKTKPEWDKFDQVWAWKDPVPANSQMKIFLGSGKEYEESPDFESWLIVADTNPLQNGGIHYRWYFVSINGGRTQTLDTTSGPYEDMPLDEYMPKVVVLKDKKFTYSPTQTKAASPGISQRSLVPGNHSNSHLISAYAGEFMLWENIPGITNYSWGTDDPNLNITQQGFFIAPYEMNPGTDPAYEYVWVSFNNPLGELTIITEQNNAY